MKLSTYGNSANQRGNTMYMTPEEIHEKFPDAVIGSGVRIESGAVNQ